MQARRPVVADVLSVSFEQGFEVGSDKSAGIRRGTTFQTDLGRRHLGSTDC